MSDKRTFTLQVERITTETHPSEIVALFRMSLPLASMASMYAFVYDAYGEGCICAETPKGWLTVCRKPSKKSLTRPPIPRRVAVEH